ncbi:MAG: sulfite exporter TauE/SafE family protein [Deltaproteobacteria bacterium]|nr:sulfite exporter TauE/SafE family protein [Candidatus Zymogenaceae bacterium]
MEFLAQSSANWFMFPISILVAMTATGSGFGGGIIFLPIFVYFLGMTVPESVGTGMVTELVGMSSALVGYVRQRQIEFNIAFPMIMLTIPGVIIGLHLALVTNEAILKVFFGLIVVGCAIWTFVSMAEKKYGNREGLGTEEIYPFAWVPFLGGLSSGLSSVGTAETIFPVLERVYKLNVHRAVATTVMVEAIAGYVATSINIWEGQIRWDVAIFTMTGVLCGGQLGPILNRFAPEAVLKILFSMFVLLTGAKMIADNLSIIIEMMY